MFAMARYRPKLSLLRSTKPLWIVAALLGYMKAVSVVPAAKSIPTELGAWALIWLATRFNLTGFHTSSSDKDPKGIGASAAAVCTILAFGFERYTQVERLAPLLAPVLLVITYIHRTFVNGKSFSKDHFLNVVKNPTETAFVVFSAAATVALIQTAGYPSSIAVPIAHAIVLALFLDNASEPAIQLYDDDEDKKWSEKTLLNDGFSPSEAGRSLIEQTSIRTAALFAVCMAISPQGLPLDPLYFGLIVVARAAFWLALLDMKVRGHSVAAAVLYTISVQVVTIQQSNILNQSVVLCALSLFFVWHPRSGVRSFAGSRPVLICIALLPVLALISTQYLPSMASTQTASPLPDTSKTPIKPPTIQANLPQHPIAKLAEEAMVKAAALQYNQSLTLTQAVARYEETYHRTPPPGFDKWFRFAEANDGLVDSYQTMTKSIHAFHIYSPAELRKAFQAAIEDEEDNQLVVISIRSGSVSVSHAADHWMVSIIMGWLNPMPKFLPDIDLLINLLHEPRIILPRKGATIGNASITDNYPSISFTDLSRRSLAGLINSTCPVTSTKPLPKPLSPESMFVSNITEALDTCLDSSMQTQHGLFISPENAKISTHPIPVITQGRPSAFSDLIFPSPYYQRWHDLGEYKEADDPDWHRKKNLVYWSGETTGGYAKGKNWLHFHRQRLITLVSDLSKPVSLLRRAKAWKLVSMSLSQSGLARFFNVKFIGPAVQCSNIACAEQEEHFQMVHPLPMSEAFKAKLVLDVDGNSLSDNYHRLLNSKSVVLKQTLFQEWHDDRLVPWAHYVPISMGMKELPEVVRYLLKTDEGQKLAHRIARQSRAWARQVLREADLRIAMMNMILEYAWLMSDERVVTPANNA